MKPSTEWKIYLAGPMGGYDEWNFPAFHKWAALLRKLGYVVLSPAETAGQVTHLSKEWYMDLDLNYVRVADEVMLLPGWRQSEGAKIEALVGQALGKRVSEIDMTPGGVLFKPVFIDLKHTELLERRPK